MELNTVFDIDIETMKGAEYLDSRDIIKAIELLEEYKEDDPERFETDGYTLDLKTLKELAEEGEGSPDWIYGETLIADWSFEEYAKELARDIGAIDPNAQWPLTYIDWDAACEALKSDYFLLDFDGKEFWVRA